MTPTKQLFVSGIPVTLTRKRVKNINLRISRNSGHVVVSAPSQVCETEILAFLFSKRNWISRGLRASKLRQQREQCHFQNGERHWFLGDLYPLELVRNDKKKAYCVIASDALGHQTLQLCLPSGASHAEKQNALERWYRENLKSLLPDIVEHWSKKLAIPPPEYRVKKMRTKWGTCNIRDRRIWISLELIQYSRSCIDYVVLHELCHFFEREHNTRFYAMIEQHMPQWRDWENQLQAQHNQSPLGPVLT